MAQQTDKSAKAAAQLALDYATEKAKTVQNGIELHNAVFGVGGKYGELFPTKRARTLFAETAEFKAINQLIQSLGGYMGSESTEPSGKFLLRLPKSMHAALLREAEAEGVSLNQLCVSKLAIDLKAAVGS